jgi:hypothetical protein
VGHPRRGAPASARQRVRRSKRARAGASRCDWQGPDRAVGCGPSERRAVRAAMRLLEAQEQDSAECVEGIRRGLADVAAGHEQPWDDFRKEFERRNGLKRRR